MLVISIYASKTIRTITDSLHLSLRCKPTLGVSLKLQSNLHHSLLHYSINHIISETTLFSNPFYLRSSTTLHHPISPHPTSPPDTAHLPRSPYRILFLLRCSCTEDSMRTRMLHGAESVVITWKV